ncbi:IDEAL domain-containing protein [Paenibacillus allorhizosphaerae]|uniref:IDEAL domain-containing protein n=1 Tax=Paenibacillus allorhizosphaerae TaxID=2849866 RepID=A0ABM8VJQ5_9BACL|nr:IDEAL domain-containing protein [Paenibacillus allorhizosphaerae]CAG7645810.1 hypothetical protein PAECIP111802_03609 [Paenibacillus allorhizosphaerae]
MTNVKRNGIAEGDWVTGNSLEDEKFIGYVESIDLGGIAKVYVTQSDREEAVGRTVEGRLAKLERLPDYAPTEPADLQSLIDLALMTRDRAWFEQLRAEQAIAAFASSKGSQQSPKLRGVSNMGTRRVNID